MGRKSKKSRCYRPRCYILRLPFELLSEIFLAYHQRVHYPSSLHSPTYRIPPNNETIRELLVLERVCRAFRVTALETPQLWTRIALTIHPDSGIRQLEAEVRGLQAWLPRSGTQCGLQIYVKCASDNVLRDSVKMFFLFEVVKILALYSLRWQELGLLLPQACFEQMRNLLPSNALGAALGTQMPMLKKVVLFRWWEDDQDDSASESMTEDEIIDVFAEAELEEVYLSRFPLDMWVVPWGQLLRFQGHRNTVEDILEMLHNAPQLEECTLTSTVDDSWGLPLSAANLPRLRSLTLDIRRSSTLINHLILPALENLVLQMVEKGGDYDEDDAEDVDSDSEDEAVGTFDATAFVGFMQRSQCALQRLHLCVQFITVSRLMECLRATPKLVKLRLEHANAGIDMISGFMDGVVRRLTPQAKCATAMPQLVQLAVLNCSRNFCVDALGDMLWLRWGTGEGERGCLESFRLEISKALGESCTMTPEMILTNERIRDLIEQGMAVDVHLWDG